MEKEDDRKDYERTDPDGITRLVSRSPYPSYPDTATKEDE